MSDFAWPRTCIDPAVTWLKTLCLTNFLPKKGSDNMRYFPAAGALSVVLLLGGCATKNFVRKTTDPINQRVDEQKQALNQTNDSLQKTQQSVTADETALNATDERARSAGTRADDAMKSAGEANNHAVEAASKADTANQQADKANRGVDDLRSQVASLDDFKEVAKASINFKFNSDKLDDDARQQLDQIAGNQNKLKHYYISVEGFTDRSGTEEYNNALSRRRADAVVAYLVTQHEIPVYRIQMIGLGKSNPVDDGATHARRTRRIAVWK
jgi:OOP family OmpA-OmpF porin